MTNPVFKSMFLLLLCLSVVACADKSRESIFPSNVELKAGDVVFRQGGSLESYAVRISDREGKYSHIGIVVDSAGTMMVVHAVPAEPDFEGDVDRVKMDTPENFFRKDRANIGEVMRVENDSAARCAAATALRLYGKRILFDHDYDDTDSTKMYCTELVSYCYRKAGLNVVHGGYTHFSMSILPSVCLLPSSIHSSPYLNSICAF